MSLIERIDSRMLGNEEKKWGQLWTRNCKGIVWNVCLIGKIEKLKTCHFTKVGLHQ